MTRYQFSRCFFLLFLILGESAFAESIWEFGAGFGFVRFEQYPAAGQTSDLYLPFPTFQYRGKTLRADDREGAKAYLFKENRWTLEMSGTGTPTLDSDKNEAREGMRDLPWILAIGPQLAYRYSPEIEFSFGVFQALMTDFQWSALRGVFIQQSMHYRKTLELGTYKSESHFVLDFKSASQEIQQQYFGVSKSDATVDRPQYHARGGFLATEFSFFQAFKKGRVSYYLGANHNQYGAGVNLKSPLYKSNVQTNFLFGLTYVFAESSRPEVEEEETSGIMNRKKQ